MILQDELDARDQPRRDRPCARAPVPSVAAGGPRSPRERVARAGAMAVPPPTAAAAPTATSAPAATAAAPATSAATSATATPAAGSAASLKFLLFLVVLAVLVLVALFTVARPIARLAIVPLAEDNPSALRIGFIAGPRARGPGRRADRARRQRSRREIEFTVEPGDTPATLAPQAHRGRRDRVGAGLPVRGADDDLGPKLQAGRVRARRRT